MQIVHKPQKLGLWTIAPRGLYDVDFAYQRGYTTGGGGGGYVTTGAG